VIERLTAQEAAPYFRHRAQEMVGDPEEWMTYRAFGGFCGAFHMHLWPGVWMGHLGALPGVYRVDEAAKAILRAFAEESGAVRVVGWVKKSNRPALALCRRIGFDVDGTLPLAEPVVMLGWRP
jgi:hypothetical protein